MSARLFFRYSVCKVSGKLEAVDKAVKILELMMSSGQEAADRYEVGTHSI